MSTSVYLSEQLVHYSHEPVTYFGFYVSWSGGEDDSAYPFTSAERRTDWLAAVRPYFPDEYEATLAAAMLACAEWGPESSREGIAWAFGERYGDIPGLFELASRFDPSEPAGTPLHGLIEVLERKEATE